jgi:hypothetical protein
VITGSFEIVATDVEATDDRILLCAIQSGDVITEVSTGHDDIAGDTVLLFDIGISDINGVDIDSDGSSSSLDLFSSDVVGGGAAVALTDRRFDDPAEDTVDQRLWELVNNESTGTPFTNNPAVTWYICLTVATAAATGAAGTVFFRVRYVRD